MTIETVSICNASCSFCSYPILDFPRRVMGDGLFEKALSLAKKAQVDLVDFTPYLGEAFIDPQLIPRIRKTRKELPNTYIWLVTNVSRINVSFGAWGREDYLQLYKIDAWDKVYNGVQALLAAKERLKSNVFIALWYRALDSGKVKKHPENVAFLGRFKHLINEVEYVDVYHDILAISGQQPKYLKLARHLDTTPLMTMPCAHLGKLACAPTGKWYCCYCSISDSFKQEQSWFYLGSADTPGLDLNQALLAKMDDWSKGNLPECCRICPAYTPANKRGDSITYNLG
ncbi:MAG: radical SAM protein [Verrucomicrobiota bacterium]